ncbi:MAG: CdaR family protein [Balneolaceae bacterium]
MKFLSFISNRFFQFFSLTKSAAQDEPEPDNFFGREKAMAFGFALFFALCLWFIVNMNRDFNVTIDVPIELVNLPDDMALSSEIPEQASVSLTSEGWKLINLYSNPPVISLSADSRQINLFEQVRSRVSYFSDMNVLQVEPIFLTIEMEEKVEKKVPVRARVDLNLDDQYDFVRDPELEPDSVTVTGAQSKLDEITHWETEPRELNNIRRNTQVTLNLQNPGAGLELNPSSVYYRMEVAEFTEAEVRIPVRTRNLPPGQAITYNPSAITVKYDVPIEQYTNIQGTRPFSVFVDYSTILEDSTGLVTPQIERISSDFNVKLRNFQPSRVSYFNIITN